MSTKIKMISLALISFSLVSITTAVQTIGISNNNLGSYLVDGSGMTLYSFRADSPGESACYGDCLNNWVPFYTENIDTSGKMNTYDFTTINREDGNLQTAYKGQPLYLYRGDSRPGDVNGQGLNKMWFIVSP
jgi:predicted lipoprotein with Yx(FWY)xxD motif